MKPFQRRRDTNDKQPRFCELVRARRWCIAWVGVADVLSAEHACRRAAQLDTPAIARSGHDACRTGLCKWLLPGLPCHRTVVSLCAASKSGVGPGRQAVSYKHAPLCQRISEACAAGSEGASGPGGHARSAQKCTLQLADASGRVSGYLKCAESPLARQRLRDEFELLGRLPPGIGPTPPSMVRWAATTPCFWTSFKGRHCARSFLPLAGCGPSPHRC